MLTLHIIPAMKSALAQITDSANTHFRTKITPEIFSAALAGSIDYRPWLEHLRFIHEESTDLQFLEIFGGKKVPHFLGKREVALKPWQELLGIAVRHIKNSGIPPVCTFGGGTCLALTLRHRESHDIDIFVPDPQLLAWLSPRLADVPDHADADYDEQANFVKICLPQGEIDFILARRVTDFPAKIIHLDGMEVPAESPYEIIAKKIRYRGSLFTSRDIFDLACMLHIRGAGMLANLNLEEKDLAIVRERLNRSGYNPEQIMVMPGWEEVRENSLAICREALAAICR